MLMARGQVMRVRIENYKQVKNHQGGFTILELIIATSIFAITLLVVTTGIMRIGQAYYKGRIQSATQEAARNVSEDIAKTIQLSVGQRRLGAFMAPDGTNGQFCVGDVRYTYYLNKKVEPANTTGALKAETIAPDASCSDPSAGTNSRELLGNNMRLLRFKVEPDPVGQAQTWRVNIRVAYGDNDLLTHYDNDGNPVNASTVDTDADGANCKSGLAGSSFCSTSQLDTLVKKRLNVL